MGNFFTSIIQGAGLLGSAGALIGGLEEWSDGEVAFEAISDAIDNISTTATDVLPNIDMGSVEINEVVDIVSHYDSSTTPNPMAQLFEQTFQNIVNANENIFQPSIDELREFIPDTMPPLPAELQTTLTTEQIDIYHSLKPDEFVAETINQYPDIQNAVMQNIAYYQSQDNDIAQGIITGAATGALIGAPAGLILSPNEHASYEGRTVSQMSVLGK